MAADTTEIYHRHREEHRLDAEQCHTMCTAARVVNSAEESRMLNELRVPAVIISASGMATGGRVVHHLKAFAPDVRNSILLAGFQAAGTRGAALLGGAAEIKIHGEYGLKRFQTRHGLAADGVVGPITLAALKVPLAHRVQLLEMALERLRWLPELGTRPFIGINIPMFRLWAWDPAAQADTSISIGVVVGRALNTQTPVMAEEMRYLVFRPYWNLPRSIVLNEVLPALARDPGYLQRHDMEIVRGGGNDAKPVAASTENLAALRAGSLRLRQRPGPKNPLGRVKFIFPNAANIYLHDTPATQLFGRARRDFSHGCVRVENPVALAQWVLQHENGLTRERVEAAMAGTSPRRVELTRAFRVVLFYMTSMVMPVDQALQFADDIYGHDTRLARALANRPVMKAL